MHGKPVGVDNHMGPFAGLMYFCQQTYRCALCTYVNDIYMDEIFQCVCDKCMLHWPIKCTFNRILMQICLLKI